MDREVAAGSAGELLEQLVVSFDVGRQTQFFAIRNQKPGCDGMCIGRSRISRMAVLHKGIEPPLRSRRRLAGRKYASDFSKGDAAHQSVVIALKAEFRSLRHVLVVGNGSLSIGRLVRTSDKVTARTPSDLTNHLSSARQQHATPRQSELVALHYCASHTLLFNQIEDKRPPICSKPGGEPTSLAFYPGRQARRPFSLLFLLFSGARPHRQAHEIINREKGLPYWSRDPPGS